jgi:hypothetical protein
MNQEWLYSIMPDEIVSTDVGSVSISKDGVLVMRYTNDLDFTLDKAKSAIKVCEEIASGNKVLAMIVTGEHGVMSTETRQYLASEEVAEHRAAVALVISNLPHRLIANFIVRMRKSYYPSQVFGNEKDALAWLKYRASK